MLVMRAKRKRASQGVFPIQSPLPSVEAAQSLRAGPGRLIGFCFRPGEACAVDCKQCVEGAPKRNFGLKGQGAEQGDGGPGRSPEAGTVVVDLSLPE